MTRLIDADALVEVVKKEKREGVAYWPDVNLLDLITNAPAVEQGEPVAWYVCEKYDSDFCIIATTKDDKRIAEMHTPIYRPIYLSPPQPQTVRDALENAAMVERLLNDIETYKKIQATDRETIANLIKELDILRGEQ